MACCIEASGGCAAAVVVGVEAPGPLDGAGAEDERVRAGAVRVAVEREVVRGRAGRVGRAVVLQLVDAAHGRRGQADEPGRTRPVVEVLVPLVADRVVGERRDAARQLRRHRGAAPEAELAVLGRHPQRGRPGVDGEDRAGQRVLGPAALRVERARVAPRAGPDVRSRIDLGVGVRLLVGDERAVIALPARLPEHLVAAEEGEVHARVARRLHVRALRARPVLVVPDGEEGAVLEQLGPEAVAVDAGEVADVVAVALEPADHRVLALKTQSSRRAAARGERAVVGDLVGAALRGCPCRGCCRRRCCRPARSCRRSGTARPRRRRRRGRRTRRGSRRTRRSRARAWRSRCPTWRSRARARTRTPTSCRSRPGRSTAHRCTPAGSAAAGG